MGLLLIIYVIGLPTHLAVGTSLITVFIMSTYEMIAYALPGKVEWLSALIVLAGSIIGMQTGVYATRFVDGRRIRSTFACLLLMVAFSIFLKQISLATANNLYPNGSSLFNTPCYFHISRSRALLRRWPIGRIACPATERLSPFRLKDVSAGFYHDTL